MNDHEHGAPIKALIVDDEEFARLHLQKTLIEDVDSGITVVGTAGNVSEAEAKIREHQPDLVFFDVEMPGENAFSFLDRAIPVSFEVIFVTAYDEYAIKAFRLNAVDYILKPICIDEVSDAVRKAKERISHKVAPAVQPVVSYRSLAASVKPDKIRLKVNNGYEIVDFANISYLEAKGGYTAIYFYAANREQNTLLSNTLNDYEEVLPDDLFVRIHRSYIINSGHLKKIVNDAAAYVVMKNHVKLPISRRRMPVLMSLFKNRNAE